MKKVLILDDEEKLRTLLARIIGLEGFEVTQAADCKSALKKLEHTTFDIMLCDVKLPDGNGVELVGKIKTLYPALEIILLTAYGTIPDGVQAIKNGAFDYIIKGDDNNKIIPLIYRALEKTELTKRIEKLEKQLDDKHSFDKIIGQSKVLKQSIDLATAIKIVLWQLTVRHFRKICWKVKCLDIKRAHLRVRRQTKQAYLKRQTTERFFWTK